MLRRTWPTRGRKVQDWIPRRGDGLTPTPSANSNAVPATMWFLIEILRDPALKQEASHCIAAAQRPPDASGPKPSDVPARFSAPRLGSGPLLQSVYAETLRLRVAALIVRETAQRDFSFLGRWIRKEVLTVSSQTEAMSPEIWSNGIAEAPRPLHQFWARRFLVDPVDLASGPRRRAAPPKAAKPTAQGGEGPPYFSLEGLAASWTPYGGGKSLCPGRHFAKREIILTTAVFLALFDIESVGRPEVHSDMRRFGFGTMLPNVKVLFRIRRC